MSKSCSGIHCPGCKDSTSISLAGALIAILIAGVFIASHTKAMANFIHEMLMITFALLGIAAVSIGSAIGIVLAMKRKHSEIPAMKKTYKPIPSANRKAMPAPRIKPIENVRVISITYPDGTVVKNDR
jgi:hypothetical protein